MSDLTESITMVLKGRVTNAFYGTLGLAWIIFHLDLFIVLFFVSEEKIWESEKVLKNIYITQNYFNFSDPRFWISLILPIFITWVLIWKVPKLILIPAFKQTEDHETQKKLIRIQKDIEVEKVKRKLSEEVTKTAEEEIKKFEAVAEQKKQVKQIEKTDPTIIWEQEYKVFENTNLFNEFNDIMTSIYTYNGLRRDFNQYGQIEFEVPENVLAYCHANGVVEIMDNRIELTEKGKFFVKLYTLDTNPLIKA